MCLYHLVLYPVQDGTKCAFILTEDGTTEARLKILAHMSEHHIDIALHGHTHKPFLCRYSMQTTPGWIMCPGRIGHKASDSNAVKPSYGMLVIQESGALEWQLKEAKLE